MNVADLVSAAADRNPDGVALVEYRSARSQTTWSEVDAAVDQVARGLTGRGLVAGQRVALVMANRVDLAVAYFGILRGGMVAVPVNPRSAADEIARMLADAGVRLVLCDETGVEQVRAAVTRLGSGERAPQVVVDGGGAASGETDFDTFVAEAAGTPAAPPDPESLAVILYTSGSTGRPRGAMLTHRALLANIEQVAAVDPPLVTPDDVCLGLLPMFHVYGLNAVLGQAVRQAATVVMVDGFDPAALLRMIADEQVTSLAIAPPVVAAWTGRDDLRAALASVRTVMCGAAPLDPDLAASFTESSGHVVEQGYGLTEAAPVVAVTLAEHRDRDVLPRPGCVGPAVPGVELRVVESGRHPRDAVVTPTDPAELWVRGSNLFSGYWPDGADGPDADGWYPTGDVGMVDESGALTLVDRVRELIIVSGFNVYPVEVEIVVNDVEGVANVAVVGQPDAETGEAVVAFVEPADGVDTARLVDEVARRCADQLARFKQPTRIELVSGLPRSVTGKVEKGRLRALARSASLNLRAEGR